MDNLLVSRTNRGQNPTKMGAGGFSFAMNEIIGTEADPTLHRDDLVGTLVEDEERPLIGRAWQLGSIVEGEISMHGRSEEVRLQCIPVRWHGDLIAIMTAGAYGAVQSGTYNTRPLVPEVLVKDDQYAVVRPRIDVDALIAMDKTAPWL